MMEDFFLNFERLQWVGAGFGVVQVLLARQNNINNYLFGMVSILISMWVYYNSQLYADILLNGYYFAMSVYGWFYWRWGKQQQQAAITFATPKDYKWALLIVAGCFAAMTYWLIYHTDSDVAVWDALAVAFAWAGMWLLAKRKLENWIFLNVSNAISIPLLIYKELYVYVGLTVFLFVVAIFGYIKWKKIVNSNQSANKKSLSD